MRIGEKGRHLDERQGIAGARGVEALGDCRRDRPSGGAGQQRSTRLGLEPAEGELREVDLVEERRLALSDCEEHSDVLCLESSCRERERLRRGRVERVCVVCRHEHRRLLGERSEEAESRGADHETVAGNGRADRQRARDRGGLRRGYSLEAVEDVSEEVVEGGEREPRLGLDAPCP